METPVSTTVNHIKTNTAVQKYKINQKQLLYSHMVLLEDNLAITDFISIKYHFESIELFVVVYMNSSTHMHHDVALCR